VKGNGAHEQVAPLPRYDALPGNTEKVSVDHALGPSVATSHASPAVSLHTCSDTSPVQKKLLLQLVNAVTVKGASLGATKVHVRVLARRSASRTGAASR
jgi:hypothetical protein